MSSGKWRPSCLGLNVLITEDLYGYPHGSLAVAVVTNKTIVTGHTKHLGPLLLTWFNFNPSMDK